MSQIYKSFFEKPSEIFRRIVLEFGGNFVYEHIEDVTNAIKVMNGPKKNVNSRLVAFPLDSDDIEKAEYFAVFTTSKNIRSPYKNPICYRGCIQFNGGNGNGKYPHIEGNNFHPMYLPEQDREMYKSRLLNSMENVVRALGKKKVDHILNSFQ